MALEVDSINQEVFYCPDNHSEISPANGHSVLSAEKDVEVSQEHNSPAKDIPINDADDNETIVTLKKKTSAMLFSEDEDDGDKVCEKVSDENEPRPGQQERPKTLKSQKLMKEERNKIYSEGQRIIRESQVNLPQHKPKQISLQDFLNRKKAKIPPPKPRLSIPSASQLSDGPVTDSPSVLADTQPVFNPVKLETPDESEMPSLRLQVSETMDCSEASTSQEIDQSEPVFKSLKEIKSNLLQNVKSFTPTLKCDGVISFDDDDDDVQKTANVGINGLMDRFARHSQKRKLKKETVINLSIVQKEVDEDGKVVLKENHVAVTTPAEQSLSITDETPGSKLLNLKKSLHAKISEKREQGRLKRVQLHELDNENVEDDAEEEVEMTDSEDDMDDDVRRELFDEQDDQHDDDDAAAEDDKVAEDAEDDDNVDLAKDDNDTDDDDDDDIVITRKRKSVIIEEEDDDDDDDDSEAKLEEVEEQTSQDDDDEDRSFEMIGTMVAPYQKVGTASTQNSIETTHNSSFFGTPFTNSHPLPIEDSQDLFTPSDHFNTDESSCKNTLLMEESQMNSEDQMEELVGLCSGKFPDPSLAPRQSQDMDELIGLCSGKFSAPPADEQAKDDAMDELLGLCSGKFEDIESKPESDGAMQEKMLESDDQADESDNDEDAQAGPKETGMNFFENEAELSGSEAESDEDLDLDEQDDVLEEELGDRDALPSDDELRDQVGRAHFKAMLDEDKKKLRLYQEMYLEDGDLHGDGQTRQRSFKWKNIDNDDSDDNKLHDSDAENNDVDDEDDVKWRLQRHEREKWLQDQKNDGADDDADVEAFKINGKVIQRQDSLSLPQTDNAMTDCSKPVISSLPSAKPKRGSFLSRKTNSLDKIAKFSCRAANANLNGARQSSKSFVFSMVSPSSQAKTEKVSKVTTQKATNGTSLKKAKLEFAEAKQPELKRSTSLFNYL